MDSTAQNDYMKALSQAKTSEDCANIDEMPASAMTDGSYGGFEATACGPMPVPVEKPSDFDPYVEIGTKTPEILEQYLGASGFAEKVVEEPGLVGLRNGIEHSMMEQGIKAVNEASSHPPASDQPKDSTPLPAQSESAPEPSAEQPEAAPLKSTSTSEPPPDYCAAPAPNDTQIQDSWSSTAYPVCEVEPGVDPGSQDYSHDATTPGDDAAYCPVSPMPDSVE
jgi:hypothetical protein